VTSVCARVHVCGWGCECEKECERMCMRVCVCASERVCVLIQQGWDPGPLTPPAGSQRLFDLVRVKHPAARLAFWYALRNTLVVEDMDTASRWGARVCVLTRACVCVRVCACVCVCTRAHAHTHGPASTQE
jgi:hypothetical protein